MAKVPRKKKTPRKRSARKRRESPAVNSVADLAGDARNPRTMSDRAAGGLRKSLERFGDLSGIVFNRRTGELVTGHQRVAQIREQYGDRPIETVDTKAEVGLIRVDAERAFAVRVVDWSPAKQRAANVAANNPAIQGKFSDDLTQYLLEIQAEVNDELPGVLDDVLLVELMASGIDTGDATADSVPEIFQVVVNCPDEAAQKELHARLKGEGLSVHLLII